MWVVLVDFSPIYINFVGLIKNHSTMRIGYYYGSYPDKRNVINQVPNARYIKVYDINRVLRTLVKLINKLLKKKQLSNFNDLFFSFRDFNLNRVDVIHFWNAVSYGKKPWLMTFETVVPRFSNTLNCHHGNIPGYSKLKGDKKVQKGLTAISKKSCKKIIALSECNLKMQKELLSEFPKYKNKIEKKLIVIHPPQKILLKNMKTQEYLNTNKPIHFMFVGRNFFRKGGLEILEAFNELKATHLLNLKLSIISSFGEEKYVASKSNQDLDNAIRLISNGNDWIDFHHDLSNGDVIKLMKKAHIGLLPTIADTYGYSVLEFQSCGCPVISTNVRALPEINNNQVGWIIDVPKNHLGEALYDTHENLEKIKKIIKNGLKSCIIDIFNDPAMIAVKSELSLARIKKHHSPEEYSIKIAEIYAE